MDNYNNLPDWVVFLHGFPEEHNNLLFDWLSAFKRPKPSSPVYIPLEQRIFVSRPVPMSFMAKLGLKDELRSNASELGWDGVVTASACCATPKTFSTTSRTASSSCTARLEKDSG